MEIAAFRVDITPTHPVVAGGYLDETRPVTSVSERLEADVVVLRSDAGADPLVIISLDLLYPGRILRAALESALPELRADQIFLAASHTHRAPMADDTKHLLGTPDPRYMDMLTSRLSSELRARLGSGQTQTAELSTANVFASHSINRRLRRRLVISRQSPSSWFGVRYLMAPNPHGPTDELVTVLVSRSSTGRAQFVIWNYACHPVAFPRRDQIAADFPHYVRNILRDREGEADLPVLFLQGFSGDTRPSATVSQTRGVRSWIRRLLGGPSFTRMTEAGYARWATGLGEVVALGCSRSLPVEDAVLSWARNVVASGSFVDGAPEPAVSFHSVRLGADFAIVGASAEIVAEFAPQVRAMAGSKQVMCVGCLDHPFGYAPTSQILHQGGYEGGDYCAAFSLGPLASDIEDQILKGFRSVL